MHCAHDNARDFDYAMRTHRITLETEMKPATRLTIIAVVVLAGILLYSTIQAQKVSCNVCIAFKGARNCARASAETQKEAAKSAQSTACGTIAHGMAESIECDNVPPASVNCAS
jgi:hypothetical protein